MELNVEGEWGRKEYKTLVLTRLLGGNISKSSLIAT
jgi:hypothetical protein